jgi:hypothetical protein
MLVAGALVMACAVLGVIASVSPDPGRVTDRDVYEATATTPRVADCTDLHCFRVLVPWTLGALPGESLVKWKAYAAAANAAAAVAVWHVALALGLSAPARWMAAALSLFGFGSLYTLHDVYTADPLMYLMGPWLTYLLLRDRIAIAGTIAAVMVLAKEFAAAPLYMWTALAWLERRRETALRALLAANTAFIVWLVLQLTLIIGFNYGYGDNASTKILSGGYLVPWVQEQSVRGALAALFNEFGAIYLLAPAGLLWAPARLRRLALCAVPVALIFGYVQQPDRALWNLHYLATPLAAITLERAPLLLAWATVALFAFANLRVGAQLPFVPGARYALAGSVLLGLFAIIAGARPGASARSVTVTA